MQGIYAERLPRRFIFFFQINKILHSLRLKKCQLKKLASCLQVRTLQWKVWFKEVLTITEKNIKMASGITLFKDFETVFAFFFNSPTDHYFGQFLVMLVVFLSYDGLIFLLLFERMISPSCK